MRIFLQLVYPLDSLLVAIILIKLGDNFQLQKKCAKKGVMEEKQDMPIFLQLSLSSGCNVVFFANNSVRRRYAATTFQHLFFVKTTQSISWWWCMEKKIQWGKNLFGVAFELFYKNLISYKKSINSKWFGVDQCHMLTLLHLI